MSKLSPTHFRKHLFIYLFALIASFWISGGIAFAHVEDLWLQPEPLSPGTSHPSGPTLDTMTPTLVWSVRSIDARHKLYIEKYPYSVESVVHEAIVPGTSYEVPPGILHENEQYRWTVVRMIWGNSSDPYYWPNLGRLSFLYFQTGSDRQIGSYLINLSADPENGGIVSGGGVRFHNETITVNATANDGYVFKNWTESGKVVSKNSSYEFKVTRNHNLVAIFEEDIKTPSITSVTPAKPEVKPTRQPFTIHGNFFATGLEVVLTAPGGTQYTIPRHENPYIKVIPPNKIEINAGLTDPGTWQAKVINPDGQESNSYPFEVGDKAMPDCIVTAPYKPSGPTTGKVGGSYDYETGGSSCEAGHSVQYQFSIRQDGGDWFDGRWKDRGIMLGEFYEKGTYDIRARARCATDTTVKSSWSPSLTVIITEVNLSLSISPAGESYAGEDIIFTAAVEGIANPEYQFGYRRVNESWTARDPGASNTYTRSTLAGFSGGEFELAVRVRKKGTTQWLAMETVLHTINPVEPSITLTINPVNESELGDTVTLEASSTGVTNPEFQFGRKYQDGNWGKTSARTTAIGEYTPKQSGLMEFGVWVREKGGSWLANDIVAHEVLEELGEEPSGEWVMPIKDHYLIQDYNNYRTNVGYHTGLDLRHVNRNITKVFTIADGVVEKTYPVFPIDEWPYWEGGYGRDGDNWRMQNIVIVKHELPNGEFVYSLYCHMRNIKVEEGETVYAGETVLGETYVKRRDGNYNRHVHLELKTEPVANAPTGENYWGYTSGHPSNYGYLNPWDYLD